MPNKLDYDELKDRLSYQYTTSVLRDSRIKRQFNIEAFNSLAREGLSLGVREKRMCLHTTLCGEEISIQYPGKESAQIPPMEYDFRPKVKLANGDLLNDFTFGQIWDVFELIEQGVGGIHRIAGDAADGLCRRAEQGRKPRAAYGAQNGAQDLFPGAAQQHKAHHRHVYAKPEGGPHGVGALHQHRAEHPDHADDRKAQTQK